MTAKLLTDTRVRQAKPGTTEYQMHTGDVPGLFLRVRPSGAKEWTLRYTLDNKRRKLSLGSYPAVSLALARQQAHELRKQLAQGIDPQAQRIQNEAEKRAAKAEAAALPQTVRELFDLWEKRDLKKRQDGGKEVRRKFVKDVFPTIGDLRLSDLRRAHFTRIMDEVVHRGAPRIAGMLLADLRQMFTFAVIREVMPVDPTMGLKKATWGGKANERDRVLSEAEVKQLANAIPSTLTEENQRAIWIMLSTCCRIGEITQARWIDVDLHEKTWVIPPENSKNGKAHIVNLSDFALTQFSALRERAKKAAMRAKMDISDWVMPARHHRGCVCSKSLAKQIGDRQRESKGAMARRSLHINTLVLPGGKWTPHDLRRTGATMMGEMGIRVEVIEKCLNHTEQNRLIRIYQRQEQRAEMKHAWEQLGAYIERLAA